MSQYVMRVTIVAPEAMVDDANSLAAVLGFGPADLGTFNPPAWRDPGGNLYSVASTLATETFPTSAASPLDRPEWDAEPYQVNMAGANRAQDALVIYDPEAPLQADPSRILAVIHPKATTALLLAGVSASEGFT